MINASREGWAGHLGMMSIYVQKPYSGNKVQCSIYCGHRPKQLVTEDNRPEEINFSPLDPPGK